MVDNILIYSYNGIQAFLIQICICASMEDKMGQRLKTIIISGGIFLSITLILCITAKIMQKDASATVTGMATNVTITNSADIPEITKVPDEPEVSITPNPTITPTPEPEKRMIAVNAGHQGTGNKEMEPIGPGALETKVKVSYGTTGVVSKVPEYELTLAVALKLRDVLQGRGYNVLMIRETHEVNLSESERANIANVEAELIVHIHGNADGNNSDLKGTMAFAPSKDNKYSGNLSEECGRLGSSITEAVCNLTGKKNWGVIYLDNLTALNWTKIPAAHIEVGYLTNMEEDQMLQTEEYQQKLADGIADGIDSYYEIIQE